MHSMDTQAESPLQNTIIVITGVMAAGKSTVAEALACRFPRAVHLRGDAFRRFIVAGREEMTANASPEALRQLNLRYELTAAATRMYWEAGFTVVVQDNYLGRTLGDFLALLGDCPVHCVALCPSAQAVERREAGRGKKGYVGFDVAGLHRMFMEETPRLGLWLDTSEMTVEQTVDAILADAEQSRLW